VRRFELVEKKGTPDRPGINPFTKQPIVLRGKPARIKRCDVELRGTEVILRWIRLDGDQPVGKPHRESQRLPDAESAERYIRQLAVQLANGGYSESTTDPQTSNE
jgi:hypothetical protein